VKTVSTLRVVSKADAPAGLAELDVADLPGEVQVALADIASVAREGLLAMSVATGMAVMQAMFDAEITAACGPKGKHDADRVAVRHGGENGSVVLGGCRCAGRGPGPPMGMRCRFPPTGCSPPRTSSRGW
jgi:putative transposase